MLVKDLLVQLQSLPPDAPVVLQKDAEGNGYSPLRGVDPDAVYLPDNTWSGRVFSMAWTASDADMTATEWRDVCAMPRCVVLFPMN